MIELVGADKGWWGGCLQWFVYFIIDNYIYLGHMTFAQIMKLAETILRKFVLKQLAWLEELNNRSCFMY